MAPTHIAHVAASLECDEQIARTSGLLDALDACAIVAITDGKGRILYDNQQFQRLSRYSMSELRGRDHRLLNSEHHPKSCWKEMYWAAQTRRVDAFRIAAVSTPAPTTASAWRRWASRAA